MSGWERAVALLAPRHLVDRRRYGASRAEDLARLRARFAAQPSPRDVSRTVVEAAERVAELKRALTAAYREVRACAGCAEGCSSPGGAYPGGRCCGTETLTVFTQREVRRMKLAGRSAPTEAAGFARNAGCALRGPRGCVAEPEDRPVRCLVYECEELAAELDAAGAEAVSVEAGSADADRTGADRARALRVELVEAVEALERRLDATSG